MKNTLIVGVLLGIIVLSVMFFTADDSQETLQQENNPEQATFDIETVPAEELATERLTSTNLGASSVDNKGPVVSVDNYMAYMEEVNAGPSREIGEYLPVGTLPPANNDVGESLGMSLNVMEVPPEPLSAPQNIGEFVSVDEYLSRNATAPQSGVSVGIGKLVPVEQYISSTDEKGQN